MKIKTRIKNNLPKGVGMQLVREIPSCDLYPGKQRFLIEFLVNREFTSEELFALIGSMDGITDSIDDSRKELKIEKKEAKNYKIHNLIFSQEKKQDYIIYRVGFVGEKDINKEDIDMELQSTIEVSIGGSLEYLWSDIWKVNKFPCEKKAKEVIFNISEKKLLDSLNKKNHSEQG